MNIKQFLSSKLKNPNTTSFEKFMIRKIKENSDGSIESIIGIMKDMRSQINAGWNGFIYTGELHDTYKKYLNDINHILDEYRDETGEQPENIKSFTDTGDRPTWYVWFAAEWTLDRLMSEAGIEY